MRARTLWKRSDTDADGIEFLHIVAGVKSEREQRKPEMEKKTQRRVSSEKDLL
jgi:hypothetical protein